jgi:hypothetical protein
MNMISEMFWQKMRRKYRTGHRMEKADTTGRKRNVIKGVQFYAEFSSFGKDQPKQFHGESDKQTYQWIILPWSSA